MTQKSDYIQFVMKLQTWVVKKINTYLGLESDDIGVNFCKTIRHSASLLDKHSPVNSFTTLSLFLIHINATLIAMQ